MSWQAGSFSPTLPAGFGMLSCFWIRSPDGGPARQDDDQSDHEGHGAGARVAQRVEAGARAILHRASSVGKLLPLTRPSGFTRNILNKVSLV